MSIGERLRLLRGRFDLSQADMSSKFGIPSGSWKKYEAGPSEPGAGALRGLAEGGVNINWLLTGEGEMLLSDQTKGTDTIAHNQINTFVFMRIFERLLEKDFPGSQMGNSYLAYFSALIYSRVMSESGNGKQRSDVRETSVKELGLILLDSQLNSLESTISYAQQTTPDSPHIEPMLQAAQEYAALLGSLRGKFAGRMLGPGTQLEDEFLNGIALSLALSDDSNPK